MSDLEFEGFSNAEVDEHDTALGAMLREAARRAQRTISDTVTRAVEHWAAQCGMKPAVWLEIYEPVVLLGTTEHGKIPVTIRAQLRKTGEPRFELDLTA